MMYGSGLVRIEALRLDKITAAALSGGVLLLGVLLSACDSSEATPAPPTPPATATPEIGSALPLERFHYVVTATVRGQPRADRKNEVVVTTEGDYQSPDRHSFTHTVAIGPVTQTRSAVVVEDDAWLLAGDAVWRPIPRAEAGMKALIDVSYSTARGHFLDSAWFEEARTAAERIDAPTEMINGIAAVHYRVGPEGEEFFREFLAGDALLGGRQQPSWEVWLANDGAWPVRIALSALVPAGTPALDQLGVVGPATVALRIDISRPDDPALLVQTPS
jgi:hypothetical protein